MLKLVNVFILILMMQSCFKEVQPTLTSSGQDNLGKITNGASLNTYYFTLPSDNVTITGNCDARYKDLEVKLDSGVWTKLANLAGTHQNACSTNQTFTISLAPIDDFFSWTLNIENQIKEINIRGDFGILKGPIETYYINSQSAYLPTAPVITSSTNVTVNTAVDNITITGTCETRVNSIEISYDNETTWNLSNTASAGTSITCSTNNQFTIVLTGIANFINFSPTSNSQTKTVVIRGDVGFQKTATDTVTLNSGDIIPPNPPKVITFSSYANPKVYITDDPGNTDTAGYTCSIDDTTYYACSDSDVITSDGSTELTLGYSGNVYVRAYDGVGNESTKVVVEFVRGNIGNGIDREPQLYIGHNNEYIITNELYLDVNTSPSLFSLNIDGTLNTDMIPRFDGTYNKTLEDSAGSYISLKENSIYKFNNNLTNDTGIDTTGINSTIGNIYDFLIHSQSDIYYIATTKNLAGFTKIVKFNSVFTVDPAFATDISFTPKKIIESNLSIYAIEDNNIAKTNDSTGALDTVFDTTLATKNDNGKIESIYKTSINEIAIAGHFTSFNSDATSKYFYLLQDNGTKSTINFGTGLSSTRPFSYSKHLNSFMFTYNTFNTTGVAGTKDIALIDDTSAIFSKTTSAASFNYYNHIYNFDGSYYQYSTTSKRLEKYNSSLLLDTTFSNTAQKYTQNLDINHIIKTSNGKLLISSDLQSNNQNLTQTTGVTVYQPNSLLKTTSAALNLNTRLKKTASGKYYAYGVEYPVIGHLNKWIVKLNSDFTIDTSFTVKAVGGTISDSTLEVLPDDSIIVYSGGITSYDGNTLGNIIKIEANGSVLLTGFNDHSGQGGLSLNKVLTHTLVTPDLLMINFSSSSPTFRGSNITNANSLLFKLSDGSLEQTLAAQFYSLCGNYNSKSFYQNNKFYCNFHGINTKVHDINGNNLGYVAGAEDRVKYLKLTTSQLLEYRFDSSSGTSLKLINTSTDNATDFPIECLLNDIHEIKLDNDNKLIISFNSNTLNKITQHCNGHIINGIARFNLDGTLVKDRFVGYRSSGDY